MKPENKKGLLQTIIIVGTSIAAALLIDTVSGGLVVVLGIALIVVMALCIYRLIRNFLQ